MGEEMIHPRHLEYVAWIAEHVGADKGYAKCVELTEAMQKAFPELQRRKGFFHSDVWGQRSHWWMRTPAGDIVDPSGCQHPDGYHFPLDNARQYEDLTDCTDEEMQDRVPSGVCMECGEPVYRGANTCSSECADAAHREFNG